MSCIELLVTVLNWLIFKMTIIKLDGISMQLEPADLDKNGITGGIESIQQKIDTGIQPVMQPTELGETLKELNLDTLDTNIRMSGIDMRARLHHSEVTSILALDALVSLGVLPTKCLVFTRQKKRLSVSLEGKGREEIVNIVAGKRELEAKSGISGVGDRVKNFFGMQPK